MGRENGKEGDGTAPNKKAGYRRCNLRQLFLPVLCLKCICFKHKVNGKRNVYAYSDLLSADPRNKTSKWFKQIARQRS